MQPLLTTSRAFDVKGLSSQGIDSLEIEQVYVELTVDPKQAAGVSPHPMHKGVTAVGVISSVLYSTVMMRIRWIQAARSKWL